MLEIGESRTQDTVLRSLWLTHGCHRPRAGPTGAIFTGFFANLVAYAEYLPTLSNPFGRDDDNFPSACC
jgi:hypothetical protein